MENLINSQSIFQLLYLDPEKRISSLEALQKHNFIADLDFDKILHREIKPPFVPSKDHLNCDPTYELEEMIIESKPLHKKKKRLAKQNSKRELSNQSSVEGDTAHDTEENIFKYFRIFNRDRELPGHNQEESHPAHQEKDNECYESQDELEAPVRAASKPRVTKQVTFDSSELHTTSKKPISSIGASTSFS
uniref:AGC-kinase C-terminal domain-containing protein n=1 Tax=Magallana gigas TaxID=29159 RepID=A0A8W8IJD3_MAGGI